jgi:hypothetical protein
VHERFRDRAPAVTVKRNVMMADGDVIEDCFTGSNAPKDATHAAIIHMLGYVFGYCRDHF